MEPEAPQVNSLPPPSDIELYCVQCGYNLRGLSGEPRRCPECFYLNPVGEAELSAEIISAQLRRMETAPALCVGSVLLAAVFGIPGAVIALESWDPAALSCCGVPFAAAVIVWFGAMTDFASSCLGKPGWFRALMRYHFYGLVMSLVIVIAVAAAAFGGVLVVRSSPELVLWMVLLLVLIGWLVPRGARWGHRKAKETMEPMQREVAVTLARQRIRRALARPH